MKTCIHVSSKSGTIRCRIIFKESPNLSSSTSLFLSISVSLLFLPLSESNGGLLEESKVVRRRSREEIAILEQLLRYRQDRRSGLGNRQEIQRARR